VHGEGTYFLLPPPPCPSTNGTRFFPFSPFLLAKGFPEEDEAIPSLVEIARSVERTGTLLPPPFFSPLLSSKGKRFPFFFPPQPKDSAPFPQATAKILCRASSHPTFFPRTVVEKTPPCSLSKRNEEVTFLSSLSPSVTKKNRGAFFFPQACETLPSPRKMFVVALPFSSNEG